MARRTDTPARGTALAAIVGALLCLTVAAVAGTDSRRGMTDSSLRSMSMPPAVMPPSSMPASSMPARGDDSVFVAPYVEVEDGRTLARLEAEGRRSRRGPRLVLRILTAGPGIDAVQTWGGVPGANVATARELDTLLRTNALTARLRGDRPAGPVAIEALGRARLLHRRLDADGRLDLDARTAPLPLGVRLVTPPLSPGPHVLEVLARGEVRLVVRIEATRDVARAVAIDATGGRHRNLADLVRAGSR